jgi:hypothetical protein
MRTIRREWKDGAGAEECKAAYYLRVFASIRSCTTVFGDGGATGVTFAVDDFCCPHEQNEWRYAIFINLERIP